MDTLTQTIQNSIQFENHRKLLTKAEELLELSGRAYRMHERKKMEQEIHKADGLIGLAKKAGERAIVYLAIYHRIWSSYKRVIGQMYHQ